eukprot:gb/GEZN01002341.1/.p1 GENE.gb/GEZN01002341.1/~~gb/GEZN01002341.1/.p1  ORF type:complete len:710 (+),score=58.17 gb/GEZN01002341.1/:213-2342(+)
MSSASSRDQTLFQKDPQKQTKSVTEAQFQKFHKLVLSAVETSTNKKRADNVLDLDTVPTTLNYDSDCVDFLGGDTKTRLGSINSGSTTQKVAKLRKWWMNTQFALCSLDWFLTIASEAYTRRVYIMMTDAVKNGSISLDSLDATHQANSFAVTFWLQVKDAFISISLIPTVREKDPFIPILAFMLSVIFRPQYQTLHPEDSTCDWLRSVDNVLTVLRSHYGCPLDDSACAELVWPHIDQRLREVLETMTYHSGGTDLLVRKSFDRLFKAVRDRENLTGSAGNNKYKLSDSSPILSQLQAWSCSPEAKGLEKILKGFSGTSVSQKSTPPVVAPPAADSASNKQARRLGDNHRPLSADGTTFHLCCHRRLYKLHTVSVCKEVLAGRDHRHSKQAGCRVCVLGETAIPAVSSKKAVTVTESGVSSQSQPISVDSQSSSSAATLVKPAQVKNITHSTWCYNCGDVNHLSNRCSKAVVQPYAYRNAPKSPSSETQLVEQALAVSSSAAELMFSFSVISAWPLIECKVPYNIPPHKQDLYKLRFVLADLRNKQRKEVLGCLDSGSTQSFIISSWASLFPVVDRVPENVKGFQGVKTNVQRWVSVPLILPHVVHWLLCGVVDQHADHCVLLLSNHDKWLIGINTGDLEERHHKLSERFFTPKYRGETSPPPSTYFSMLSDKAFYSRPENVGYDEFYSYPENIGSEEISALVRRSHG